MTTRKHCIQSAQRDTTKRIQHCIAIAQHTFTQQERVDFANESTTVLRWMAKRIGHNLPLPALPIQPVPVKMNHWDSQHLQFLRTNHSHNYDRPCAGVLPSSSKNDLRKTSHWREKRLLHHSFHVSGTFAFSSTVSLS